MVLSANNGSILSVGVDRQSAGAFIRVLLSCKMLFELPRPKSSDEAAYISPMYMEDKPAHVGLLPGARQHAISEYPDADREWVGVVKRFLEKE